MLMIYLKKKLQQFIATTEYQTYKQRNVVYLYKNLVGNMWGFIFISSLPLLLSPQQDCLCLALLLLLCFQLALAVLPYIVVWL